MSDQPRRRLKPVDDNDFEVVDPPPTAAPPPAAKPAMARRVVAKPIAPPTRQDDDEDDWEEVERPRRRAAEPPHWFFRYVVNLRGAIAFAVLVSLLTAARVAVWLTREPQKPATPNGQTNMAGKTPPGLTPGFQAPDIGPSPAAPPSPAGWQEYTDHLGTFVVRVPDGAKAESVPVQEWGGSQKIKPRGVRWEKGAVAYYLIVVDEWPPRRAGDPPPDDWRADMMNGSLLSRLGSYYRLPVMFIGSSQPKPVWLAGKRAAAVSQTSTDDKQVMHLRGFQADGLGYYLAVVGSKELANNSPDVTPFFDGFKLTPGSTPPAGATAPPEAAPPAKSPTRRKKG